MSAAVLQTLGWTGALIALVLLLRRPVARAFGPQYAYALWALPVIRLVLPPLTLPAWMAPADPVPSQIAASPAPVEATRATLAEPLAWQAENVPASFSVAAPPPPAEPAFDVLALIDSLPLVEALLLLWLGGAGVFLWRRFAAYFELREQLLAEAREVGSAPGPLGSIRLVETPGTAAPLAFGVLDPVIALPPGFMALHDRRARDLALAHELAHHRGLDLLVNVLVQPLFALHWFTPLATYGWLALRRDQEAACDARVIARSSAEERAAYARLIAGFAAGPNLALAAPMACPVLGEKSIIERLRSLTMSHISPRRRMAGRALLGLGLLALPLTATISYAAAASEDVPAVPEPPAPPAPPAPPSPPEAPEPPEAPMPPEAPHVLIFKSTHGDVEIEGEGDGNVVVTERVERGEDGKERKVRIVRRLAPGQSELSEAEHAEMEAALREGLAEADKALADLPRVIREARIEADAARAEAGRARAEARAASRTRVMMLKECTSAMVGEAEVTTGRDGSQTVMVCQPRVAASARLGLEQAREEIARDKSIPEETRKEVLRTLDAQIARWKDKEG